MTAIGSVNGVVLHFDDVPGCTSVAGVLQVPAEFCRYESPTGMPMLPPAPATHWTWIGPVGKTQGPKLLSRSPQALPSKFEKTPWRGGGTVPWTGVAPAGTGVENTAHVPAPVGGATVSDLPSCATYKPTLNRLVA